MLSSRFNVCPTTSIEPAEQLEEIQQTMALLKTVTGQRPTNWIMCYPYESYSEPTLDLLREAGCSVAFTTKVGLVADLSSPLDLCRLDTNDLACVGDAPLSEWTRQALGTVDRETQGRWTESMANAD